jgi:DNA-binding protein
LLKLLQALTIQVPVAAIRATENLKTDFDAMVNYVRNFINTINQETQNVAPAASGNERLHSNKNILNGKAVRMTRTSLVYEKAKWWKLPAKERKHIIKARGKRNISRASSATASASAPSGKKVKFEVEDDKSEPLSHDTNQRMTKKNISHPND